MNNYIKINKDYLLANLNALKTKYNYKNLIIDVQNNAFNHGMYLITYLSDINYLFVNSLNDVLKIRKYNKNINIIYEGEINEDNIYDLIVNNAIIINNDIDFLLNLELKDEVKIILSIDIYNYNGLNDNLAISNTLKLLHQNKKLKLIGLITKTNNKDYDTLLDILKPLSNLELIILKDTYANYNFFNALKIDNLIYGLNISIKTKLKKEVSNYQQIFSLNSKITQINPLNIKKNTYIATFPFGYLQGMPSSITKVFLHNKLYKVLEVNSNYTNILVDETVKINDIVEITSNNNPLENYFKNANVALFNLFSHNLPIIYEEDNILSTI